MRSQQNSENKSGETQLQGNSVGSSVQGINKQGTRIGGGGEIKKIIRQPKKSMAAQNNQLVIGGV